MANTKVTGDVIANGTISTVHLADDAITAAKLDSTATGITFADLTVDTDTLYVDAANNRVGIGITSPDKKLHIVDTSAGAVTYPLRLQNSGTTVGTDVGLIFTTKTSGGGSASSTIRSESEDTSGNSSLVFTTPSGGSTAERMRITSSGNVSIDRTTNYVGGAPSGTDGRFNVYTAVGSSAWAQQMRHDSTTGNGLFIRAGASSSYYTAYFAGYDESNVHFVVRGDGNVGIGTTTMNTTLNLYSSSNTQIGFQDASTGTGSADGFRVGYNGTYGQMWLFENAAMRFASNNTERMRITSGGNVNVGTYESGAGSITGPFVVTHTSSRFMTVSYEDSMVSINSKNNNNNLENLRLAGDNVVFYSGTNTTGSEKMRITSGGKTLIGMTSEQNAGKVQIDSGASENGGILDIAGSGWYRYYTRVCRNATSVNQAGYWHIKTNIAANSNTMFLAKFYGYIYGSSQILDLTHAGYAYSATSTVINQATTNNGSDSNASSAVYVSANGSKVTFRIAFGSGSTFSTYFAGVFMDIAFPNPAGQGHDFEIEAQSFSQSTTVY